MTAKKWLLCSSLCLILLHLFTTATAMPTTSDLAKQRILFQQAEKALKTNQIPRFRSLQSQLNGYPLQPYLDYLYLRHRLEHVNHTNIKQFLTENKDTFYAQLLRKSWLDRLAKAKQWQQFLDIYVPPQSVSRQCFRLQALIATQRYEQALKDTPDLWLSAKSQPSACDPAFKFWQDRGLLTKKLIQQRIDLAVKANQFSLALYLAKQLPDATQTKTNILARKKVHHDPLSALQTYSSRKAMGIIQDNAISREIIQHGIARLARKSTEQAYKLWQQLKTDYSFTEDEQNKIRSSIAKWAALNREDKTLLYYGNIPNQPWRVRAALWQQNWQEVQRAIDSLTHTEKQSTRWQYWLGRSLEAQGKTQAAEMLYQNIVMQRDYYAFLAADRLQLPYQMNHNPIPSTNAELEHVLQQAEVQRLKEFYALNMMLEARRQAYQIKQTRTPRELQLISLLTHRWGWHSQTIALLGKAKYWDALNLRFPIVYKSAVFKEGKKNNLDPAWLLAVIRQESAFNSHARSPVGASGLMQLMPKTASLIARIINQPLKKQSELLNTNRNIQLGSAYLSKMYNENQFNPVLATASYNAGPSRVRQWLPTKALPADIWIENIPFNETRKYTSNVLSYAAIFEYQLKRPITPLQNRMPAIKPKKP